MLECLNKKIGRMIGLEVYCNYLTKKKKINNKIKAYDEQIEVELCSVLFFALDTC